MSRRRRLLISAVTVSALAGSVASGIALAAAGNTKGVAAPCRETTIVYKGNAATKFCGPAVAKITLGGKALTLRGGECRRQEALGEMVFALNIGTFVRDVRKAAPRQPYVGFLASKPKVGQNEAILTFTEGNNLWTTFRAQVTIKPGFKGGTLSATVTRSQPTGGPRKPLTGEFTC
jgi:hypothetical protein